MKLINAGKSKKSSKAIEKSIPPLKDLKAESISVSIDENEDIEVDENDPELLNELLELTNPEEETPDEPEDESSSESEESAPKEQPNVLSILTERLEMYKTAEAKAKQNNESSRARRFNRGIKTIQDLIKKAQAGQQVLLGDIPPLIATNLKPPPPKNEMPESTTDNFSNKPDGDHGIREVKDEEKPGTKLANVGQSITEEINPKMPRERNAVAENKSPEKVSLEKENSDERKFKNEKEENNIPRSPPNQMKPDVPIRHTPPSAPDIPKRQVTPPAPAIPKRQITPTAPDIPKRQNIPQVPGNSNTQPNKTEEAVKKVESNPLVVSLKAQREEYKLLALKAKRNNELQSALEYVKKIKELDAKISAAEKGEPVKQEPSLPSPTKNAKVLPGGSPKKLVKSPSITDDTTAAVSKYIIDTPKTVLDALEQRLRVYNDLLQKSEKQKDKAAVIRYQKIVQIYIDAIRLHKAGKKVPLQKLPTPPGCPPIPLTF